MTETRESFTTEELATIASHVGPGSLETIERGGLRYTFGMEYDETGPVEHVNDCEGLGELAWPERDRYSGRDQRPAHFTGAARKFGPNQAHDAIWWEPYRFEGFVYDGPDEVRFVSDLLKYGLIGLTLKVERRESCGHWHEVALESLWGIESPMIGAGNYDYLGEIYSDLIIQATYEERQAS